MEHMDIYDMSFDELVDYIGDGDPAEILGQLRTITAYQWGRLWQSAPNRQGRIRKREKVNEVRLL